MAFGINMLLPFPQSQSRRRRGIGAGPSNPISSVSTQPGPIGIVQGRETLRGADIRDLKLENPCIGGSIPPRATKDIVHATPTITGWRSCFGDSKSLCPVYFQVRMPPAFVRFKHRPSALLGNADYTEPKI